MAADIELNEQYKVTGGGTIALSLTIGEGQHGFSIVSLDGQRLLKVSGSFSSLHLGDAADVAGKQLLVRSVVNDVLSETNRMSITYRLRGGIKRGDFDSEGRVQNEGDSLIFEAAFDLV